MTDCLLECLREARLEKYYTNLLKAGVSNCECLGNLTMQDYMNYGVRSMDDRLRLFKLIQIVKTVRYEGRACQHASTGVRFLLPKKGLVRATKPSHHALAQNAAVNRKPHHPIKNTYPTKVNFETGTGSPIFRCKKTLHFSDADSSTDSDDIINGISKEQVGARDATEQQTALETSKKKVDYDAGIQRKVVHRVIIRTPKKLDSNVKLDLNTPSDEKQTNIYEINRNLPKTEVQSDSNQLVCSRNEKYENSVTSQQTDFVTSQKSPIACSDRTESVTRNTRPEIHTFSSQSEEKTDAEETGIVSSVTSQVSSAPCSDKTRKVVYNTLVKTSNLLSQDNIKTGQVRKDFQNDNNKLHEKTAIHELTRPTSQLLSLPANQNLTVAVKECRHTTEIREDLSSNITNNDFQLGKTLGTILVPASDKSNACQVDKVPDVDFNKTEATSTSSHNTTHSNTGSEVLTPRTDLNNASAQTPNIIHKAFLFETLKNVNSGSDSSKKHAYFPSPGTGKISRQPHVERIYHTSGYNYGLPKSSPSTGRQGNQSGQPDEKIRVCIRKRPLNRVETKNHEVDVVRMPSQKAVVVDEARVAVDLTKYLQEHVFLFDEVFSEDCSNAVVYNKAVKPLIHSVRNRRTATCFAFGQTGAGKSYTLLGNKSVPGLYMLAARDLFDLVETSEGRDLPKVWVSYYEVYCGQLYDLLNKRKRLHVRENAKQRICIAGLTESDVQDATQLQQVVQFGNSARRTGSTGVNATSSRSHGVLQLEIRHSKEHRHGRMSFIDLAGSERASDVRDSNRQSRMEGAEINQSLLALKECIRSIDQENKHTPFRQNKLSHILRESFAGNAQTVMIANIAPGQSSCENTLNTLRYADRVKELRKDSRAPRPPKMPFAHEEEVNMPKKSKKTTPSLFHPSNVQLSSTPKASRGRPGRTDAHEPLDLTKELQDAYETPIRGHKLHRNGHKAKENIQQNTAGVKENGFKRFVRNSAEVGTKRFARSAGNSNINKRFARSKSSDSRTRLRDIAVDAEHNMDSSESDDIQSWRSATDLRKMTTDASSGDKQSNDDIFDAGLATNTADREYVSPQRETGSSADNCSPLTSESSEHSNKSNIDIRQDHRTFKLHLDKLLKQTKGTNRFSSPEKDVDPIGTLSHGFDEKKNVKRRNATEDIGCTCDGNATKIVTFDIDNRDTESLKRELDREETALKAEQLKLARLLDTAPKKDTGEKNNRNENVEHTKCGVHSNSPTALSSEDLQTNLSSEKENSIGRKGKKPCSFSEGPINNLPSPGEFLKTLTEAKQARQASNKNLEKEKSDMIQSGVRHQEPKLILKHKPGGGFNFKIAQHLRPFQEMLGSPSNVRKTTEGSDDKVSTKPPSSQTSGLAANTSNMDPTGTRRLLIRVPDCSASVEKPHQHGDYVNGRQLGHTNANDCQVKAEENREEVKVCMPKASTNQTVVSRPSPKSHSTTDQSNQSAPQLVKGVESRKKIIHTGIPKFTVSTTNSGNSPSKVTNIGSCETTGSPRHLQNSAAIISPKLACGLRTPEKLDQSKLSSSTGTLNRHTPPGGLDDPSLSKSTNAINKKPKQTTQDWQNQFERDTREWVLKHVGSTPTDPVSDPHLEQVTSKKQTNMKQLNTGSDQSVTISSNKQQDSSNTFNPFGPANRIWNNPVYNNVEPPMTHGGGDAKIRQEKQSDLIKPAENESELHKKDRHSHANSDASSLSDSDVSTLDDVVSLESSPADELHVKAVESPTFSPITDTERKGDLKSGLDIIHQVNQQSFMVSGIPSRHELNQNHSSLSGDDSLKTQSSLIVHKDSAFVKVTESSTASSVSKNNAIRREKLVQKDKMVASTVQKHVPSPLRIEKLDKASTGALFSPIHPCPATNGREHPIAVPSVITKTILTSPVEAKPVPHKAASLSDISSAGQNSLSDTIRQNRSESTHHLFQSFQHSKEDINMKKINNSPCQTNSGLTAYRTDSEKELTQLHKVTETKVDSKRRLGYSASQLTSLSEVEKEDSDDRKILARSVGNLQAIKQHRGGASKTIQSRVCDGSQSADGRPHEAASCRVGLQYSEASHSQNSIEMTEKLEAFQTTSGRQIANGRRNFYRSNVSDKVFLKAFGDESGGLPRQEHCHKYKKEKRNDEIDSRISFVVESGSKPISCKLPDMSTDSGSKVYYKREPWDRGSDPAISQTVQNKHTERTVTNKNTNLLSHTLKGSVNSDSESNNKLHHISDKSVVESTKRSDRVSDKPTTETTNRSNHLSDKSTLETANRLSHVSDKPPVKLEACYSVRDKSDSVEHSLAFKSSSAEQVHSTTSGDSGIQSSYSLETHLCDSHIAEHGHGFKQEHYETKSTDPSCDSVTPISSSSSSWGTEGSALHRAQGLLITAHEEQLSEVTSICKHEMKLLIAVKAGEQGFENYLEELQEVLATKIRSIATLRSQIREFHDVSSQSE